MGRPTPEDLAELREHCEAGRASTRRGAWLLEVTVQLLDAYETERWRSFWLIIAVAAVVTHFKSELEKRNSYTWKMLEEHLPQAQRADLENTVKRLTAKVEHLQVTVRDLLQHAPGPTREEIEQLLYTDIKPGTTSG